MTSWRTQAAASAITSALTLIGCAETTTRIDDTGHADPDVGPPTARDVGASIDAASPMSTVDAALPVGTDASVPPLADAALAVDAALLVDVGMITFPTSATYILGTMSLPNGATPAGVAPGFNLDGLNSGGGGGTGCVASSPDFISLTGEAGVDNRFVGTVVGALQSVAAINAQARIDDEIASGVLLLAVRVHGIDSFTNDPSVTLDVFLVKQESCAGATCPVVGGVLPGQAWRQRAMAYATGAPATITSGTLRGTLASLPFNIDPLRFDITSATLSATILPNALVQGQVGGTIAFSQLAAAAMAIAPGTSESLLRGVVQPDLNPRAAMPSLCDGVSVGYGFTAVSAATVTGL